MALLSLMLLGLEDLPGDGSSPPEYCEGLTAADILA